MKVSWDADEKYPVYSLHPEGTSFYDEEDSFEISEFMYDQFKYVEKKYNEMQNILKRHVESTKGRQ